MFTLKFKTENAAFGDGDPKEHREECARILSDIASKLRDGYTRGMIADANGNTVGTWSI